MGDSGLKAYDRCLDHAMQRLRSRPLIVRMRNCGNDRHAVCTRANNLTSIACMDAADANNRHGYPLLPHFPKDSKTRSRLRVLLRLRRIQRSDTQVISTEAYSRFCFGHVIR